MYPPRALPIKLAEVFKLDTNYFYDDYHLFLENSKSIITDLRLGLKITKTEIARKIGATRDTWTRLKNGGVINRENYKKLKNTLFDDKYLT